jgi:flagellar capping protein FliD
LDAVQGKILKDLIDSTNTAYEEADTALDNRLTAIETEISDARPQVGTDEESGEPIYGTLDNRLDSIESNATQIRNDIDTIADELKMFDVADNISGAHTRID